MSPTTVERSPPTSTFLGPEGQQGVDSRDLDDRNLELRAALPAPRTQDAGAGAWPQVLAAGDTVRRAHRRQIAKRHVSNTRRRVPDLSAGRKRSLEMSAGESEACAQPTAPTALPLAAKSPYRVLDSETQ